MPGSGDGFKCSDMDDWLQNILGPLFGVLVGGVVTYIATTGAERERWRQQKKDKLAEASREGIVKALAWLDPMDRALSSANLKVSGLLRLDMDQDAFLATFPRLVSELSKLDVPPDLRLLLPSDTYSDGNRIVKLFDAIMADAIEWGQEAKLQNRPFLGLQECGQKLDALQSQIEALHAKLTTAYKATFD